MKKDSTKPYKLGVFVLAALLVLVATIYLIGQKQHLFGNAFRVNATFKDVGGLQVGSNVRFAGVNIGSVDSIVIVGNDAVKVGMLISDDAKRFVKKDSVAGIGAESMMGNKVVVLAPGSEDAAEIQNQDSIQTSVAITVDDILRQVKRTSDNAVLITSNLAQLLSSIRAGKGAIGKVFEDEAFSTDVSKTMSNFKEASAGLTELVSGARKSWLLWGAGKTKVEQQTEEREKGEKEVRDKEKERDEKLKKAQKT